MTRRPIIIAVCILLALALSAGAPKLHAKYQEYREEKQRYTALIDFCLKDIDRHNHTLAQDELRRCVHGNSLHQIDEDYYTLVKKGRAETARRVLAYAKGEEERPHLDCSRRSILLSDAYRQLGYKTRLVLISTQAKTYPNHVIVDVFNPDTRSYEMQDPTYDVMFTQKATGKRLGAEEIVALPIEDMRPCRDEKTCGWNVRSPDQKSRVNTLKTYWGVAYLNWNENKEGPLLYNPERFDIHRQTNYASYCIYNDEHCQGDVRPVQKKPPE